MNVEQKESMVLDCTGCGNEQRLLITNVKSGFFDTGWRALYSQGEKPALICATCNTEESGGLHNQKVYLEHIFEAQWRFGE